MNLFFACLSALTDDHSYSCVDSVDCAACGCTYSFSFLVLITVLLCFIVFCVHKYVYGYILTVPVAEGRYIIVMNRWFAACHVVLFCGILTMLARDVILSLRHNSVPLDPAVRRTITRSGCARPGSGYRGRRGGQRVRARASVYKHCDAISWSYTEPWPIPTVVGLRSCPSVRVQLPRQPVLRRVTLCPPDDINCMPNDKLNFVHRRVSHVHNPDEVSESVYVLNVAGLSKPHAMEHLTADLTSYDIDIAIITETHFKSKHLDAITQIPGYILYRRDRAGRRGGGVATYVRSTLQSTAWTPTNVDNSFELQWTRVVCDFIGTVYHPPKPQYRTELLLEYIEVTIDEINHNFQG